jgi:hypothetical protein
MNLAALLDECRKKMYTLLGQYATACLLGDKDNATSFNRGLMDCFDQWENLIQEVALLQSQQDETADILAEIGDTE